MIGKLTVSAMNDRIPSRRPSCKHSRRSGVVLVSLPAALLLSYIQCLTQDVSEGLIQLHHTSDSDTDQGFLNHRGEVGTMSAVYGALCCFDPSDEFSEPCYRRCLTVVPPFPYILRHTMCVSVKQSAPRNSTPCCTRRAVVGEVGVHRSSGALLSMHSLPLRHSVDAAQRQL